MSIDTSISYISERLEKLPLQNEYSIYQCKYESEEYTNLFYTPSKTNDSSGEFLYKDKENVLFFGYDFDKLNKKLDVDSPDKTLSTVRQNPVSDKTLSTVRSSSENLPAVADGNSSVFDEEHENLTNIAKIEEEKPSKKPITLSKEIKYDTTFTPTFSELSPTRANVSPYKRKRSSDSFGAENSPFTKSCDLEVSKISGTNLHSIQRTLSFDDDILRWHNKTPTLACNFGFRHSPKSRYLKRNRPSIDFERHGCQSQPSNFREYDINSSSISKNFRKIKVVQVHSSLHNISNINDIVPVKEKHFDDSITADTSKAHYRSSEHVFKPIKETS